MKKHLICIDSDGCAIDSMECKHRLCFGPLIIDVWHLEQWKDEILNRWNEINLYSQMRGINRFLGLEIMLSEVDSTYRKIDGLFFYSRWCKETTTYSNTAIEEQIRMKTHPIFELVLNWSNRVNSGVEKIAAQIKPFESVKETLVMLHKNADIAIVSSANPHAVQDEWTRFGLMEHVDYVMAQDAGTKTDCIAKLIKQGYKKDCVLMVGDAHADLDSANVNGVSFYPIIPGYEKESWGLLRDEVACMFLNDCYESEYMNNRIHAFNTVLKDKSNQ